MTYSKRRVHGTHGAHSTIKQLVTPIPKTHTANFSQILPSAMAKLITEGLFIADPSVEGGYRITPAGRKRLREIEGR